MSNLEDNNDIGAIEQKCALCKNCKYKLPAIKIGNYIQDRSGFSICGVYDKKPVEMMHHGDCDFYIEEE